MTERFPERQWFPEWRKALDNGGVSRLCEKLMTECLEVRRGTVQVKPPSKAKIEALYEFCAARGQLSSFEFAWKEREEVLLEERGETL